jgi:HK97 family phage major capsid protein/HK97 family phage prohead protease
MSALALRHDVRLLTVKAFEDVPQQPLRLTGIATSPTPDRRGDIVEPAGARFAAEIPLLLHHHREVPVGTARLRAVGTVIEFDAELPVIDEPGAVKNEVDRAKTSLRHKLIRGVSIGFQPLGEKAIELLKDGGLRFLQTEILELSLVTVPANSEATLAIVKALDTDYQAAAGLPSRPGDAGLPLVRLAPKTPSTAMMTKETIGETIRSYEATLTAKQAQIDAILNSAREQHLTLDATQREEHDTLRRECEDLVADIGRWREREKVSIAQATPVPATANGRPAIAMGPISVKPNVQKGGIYTRAMMANMACRGNKHEAAQYASERWPDTPEVALFLKAAVAAGTTTAAGYAAELVGATAEFIELLWPATAIGKIVGLQKVPWNIKVPGQTGGGTYNWVGEGKPKPVTSLAFTANTLPITKTAGIIVMTKELAMSSSPSAEQLARTSMINGITKFVDAQFIDPAVTAVAGSRPASITNGVTPIASVGPLTDIVAIASAFTALGAPLEGLTYIMSPANALVLSFQRESTGALRFPGLGVDGGNVNGLKVITSGAAGTNVVGLLPQLILYNDEGGVTVDVSQEATLQMSDTPMDPVDATTVMVSLFQNNYLALRAEWFIGWLKASANACKYVNNATYTIPAGTTLEAMAGPSPSGKNNGKRE